MRRVDISLNCSPFSNRFILIFANASSKTNNLFLPVWPASHHLYLIALQKMSKEIERMALLDETEENFFSISFGYLPPAAEISRVSKWLFSLLSLLFQDSWCETFFKKIKGNQLLYLHIIWLSFFSFNLWYMNGLQGGCELEKGSTPQCNQINFMQTFVCIFSGEGGP